MSAAQAVQSTETPAPVFNVRRKDLSEAIKLVKLATRKHSGVPILEYVRIETVDPWFVQVTAYDAETSIQVTVPAVETTPGTIVVTLASLEKLVKAGKGDHVRLTSKARSTSPNHLVDVTVDTTTLKGQTNAGDFPPLPTVEAASSLLTDAHYYADAVGRCLPFTSDDETRYNLCGVAISENWLAATDGHRAHLIRNVQSHGIEGAVAIVSELACKALVAAVKQYVAKSGDTLCVEVGVAAKTTTPQHVRFTLGPVVITTRVIDGQFPDILQVMPSPEHSDTAFHVDRDALSEAVKYVTTLAEKMTGVRLAVSPEGELATRFKNEDVDAARAVKASVTRHNPCDLALGAKSKPWSGVERTDANIQIHAGYLTQAIKALPGKGDVECHMTDGDSPILFVDGDDSHVIMPMCA